MVSKKNASNKGKSQQASHKSPLPQSKGRKQNNASNGASTRDGQMNDWITALAKQSATQDNILMSSSMSASTSSTKAVAITSTTTKEERIQKRAAKKAHRLQIKEERFQKRLQARGSPGIQKELQSKSMKVSSERFAGKSQKNSAGIQNKAKTIHRITNRISTKEQIKHLSERWIALRKAHKSGLRQALQDQEKKIDPDDELKPYPRHLDRPYNPSFSHHDQRIKRTRPLNETNIQPRPSDYSGIGLARKSLFLSFQDPSHVPKLEEEFLEHIPGFFGKQRTKAMKRQLDGNMLWRKLADGKQNKGGKVALPKKFANMSPDDRINAMIDAGMI